MTTRCLKCARADRSGRSGGAAVAATPPRPTTPIPTSTVLATVATRRPRRNRREQCRTFMAPPHPRVVDFSRHFNAGGLTGVDAQRGQPCQGWSERRGGRRSAHQRREVAHRGGELVEVGVFESLRTVAQRGVRVGG